MRIQEKQEIINTSNSKNDILLKIRYILAVLFVVIFSKSKVETVTVSFALLRE